MNRLALLLLLVPAIAFADKSYNLGSDVTHDCAKEPEVSINVSGATFRFTGTCKKISINGGENKVEIEAISKLSVNGGDNAVAIGAVDAITVNGSDNNATYKKGLTKAKPRVKLNGADNKVTKTK
jgi:hypothetical protein